MSHSFARALGSALTFVAIVGCTHASPHTTDRVEIHDFSFAPHRLNVKAGTTVVWTNHDNVFHTVTSGSTNGPENHADGTFRGELHKRSVSFRFTFDKPGTYSYFCERHNVMNGVVQVSK